MGLVGLRGCGKTTLGRWLGELYGYRFVDLDDRTAGVLGCATAGGALAAHGEDAFRAGEVEALRGVIGEAGIVLALGGGTPTAPGASDMLRRSGMKIVYLRAQPGALRARLSETDVASRPSLTGAGTLDEIGVVFARRDPLYRTLGVTVNTDGQRVTQTVRLVDEALFG